MSQLLDESKLSPVLVKFLANVKESQCIWGLQDEAGEGWVVCDSIEFEETDVMPLWSTEAEAKSHCTEEWANYQTVAISLNEFLEFWVADLSEDEVLVGPDWSTDGDCIELEPIDLAQHLADIEALPQ